MIDTEHMQAKSQGLFLKEFSISIVADNLTIQLRRQAAELARLDPRDVIFTGAWPVYRHMHPGIEVSLVSERTTGLIAQLNTHLPKNYQSVPDAATQRRAALDASIAYTLRIEKSQKNRQSATA